MRYLPVLLLLCAITARAQDADRVNRLVAKIPQFKSWTILIASESQWNELRKQGAENTAVTNLNTSTTYIRASFLASADDKLLRHVLEHEAAHIATRSTNEQRAEAWAWQHE